MVVNIGGSNAPAVIAVTVGHGSFANGRYGG